MPPPPRAREALVAMKNIGFSSKVAGPILKKLLEVYENNWEYIEQDGYQVLIDAILEEQEKKVADGNKQDAVAVDDPDYSRKRLRKQSENSSSMLGSDAPGETSLKKPKVEADVSTEAHLRERCAEPVPLQVDYGGRPEPESPQADNRGRAEPASEVGNREKKTELALLQSAPNSEGPEHDLPLITRRETRALARTRKVSAAQENAVTCIRDKQPAGEGPRDLIFKEPKIEPGTEVLKDSMSTPPTSKDKEDDDLMEFEVPIDMIPPHDLHGTRNEGLAHQSQQSQSDSSLRGISCLRTNATESLAAQNVHHKEDKGKGKGSSSDIALENGKASELVTAQEASSSTVDIASSDTGAVKLLFSFNSDRPDLRMPSMDALFKTVEERCLKSYKILLPDFSLRQVMKDMCQIASELTTGPRNDEEENTVKSTPVLDSTRKSNVQSILGEMPVNGSPNDLRAPEDSETSQSLTVVQQPQIALGDLRPPHDPSDITKGSERLRISLVNNVSNEKYPSSFHYIPHNLVYQNAYVNFSLARIGDEDCCADCYGDCVAATIPCACARETGGEFAYTSDGLVKEAFLDECISMNREPRSHPHVYCEDCPLERSKNVAVSGKCKGHLVRKFIKECWSKCGCSMNCTNRTVQRGINCNLQVFFTPEGKGWGLRTLDELPRGAFVCEYVGEVLTNMELYNRTIQSTGNAKHTYPVLLDADWGSEGVLKAQLGDNGNMKGREFYKAFDEACNLVVERYKTILPLSWKLRRLLDLGTERKLKQKIKIVHEYAVRVVKSRKESVLGDDLVSRFIAEKDEYSDEFLRDIIVSFVLAGRDTTSATLTWFFWHIATRPDVASKIMDEIRRVRGGSNSDCSWKARPIFTLDQTRDMHYLHAALSETLRLYPPVPLQGRVSTEDDALPSGVKVRKRQQVMYNSYAMGRMERIWGADCREFRPERWVDESGVFVPVSPYQYPVFHAGPRMCLGKDMAYIQMKVVAASVMERFEVEVVEVEKERLPELVLIMKMKDGLKVRVRERDQAR